MAESSCLIKVPAPAGKVCDTGSPSLLTVMSSQVPVHPPPVVLSRRSSMNLPQLPAVCIKRTLLPPCHVFSFLLLFPLFLIIHHGANSLSLVS
jgi:hypothetical protein